MSDRAAYSPPNVYYITHADNLPSIFRHGVLSHNNAAKTVQGFKAVYDQDIVNKRQRKKTPNDKSLWDFANFYFNAKNPMLYRVYVCEKNRVVVLKMKTAVCQLAEYVAIGNAAADASRIVEAQAGLKKIRGKDMQKYIAADSWNREEGKRLIMSELLVPEKAPAEYIDTIYIPKSDMVPDISKLAGGRPVAPEPRMFFSPNKTERLRGAQIDLIDGDMFFSRLQTLTVSVNTVGVMGGGLAARAKFNFPNLYVNYQELCRGKKLTTKKPVLYREDYSYDEHMADAPATLTDKPNDEKWFLLFATKEHWRNPSRIEYIEDGLKWLVANVKALGIKSLAMPALGCGLGGLSWEVVGPVMCRYLHQLNIPCEIYLPRESDVKIPQEQLTAAFLLS